MNNNIGVRNHKVFVAFAASLELAIISWVNLTLEYFDELPDDSLKHCTILPKDLCSGYQSSAFVFYFFGGLFYNQFGYQSYWSFNLSKYLKVLQPTSFHTCTN